MSAAGHATPQPHASPRETLLPTSGAFVMLYHEVPPGRERGSHWDLMLDTGSVLRTWALDEFPAIGQPVSARPLPDHRRWYLTYEGPLTPDERGDRGRVTRVAAGTFQLHEQSLARTVFDLASNQLTGQALLVAAPASPQEESTSAAASPAASVVGAPAASPKGQPSSAAAHPPRCTFLLTALQPRE